MADPTQQYSDPQMQPGQQQSISGRPYTPGFAGAIMDALRSLFQAAAPRAVMQHPGQISRNVRQGEGESDSPQTSDLGNQF